MIEAKEIAGQKRSFVWLAGGFLLATLFAAYANHFHNGFQFDDAHAIVNNQAIRSLRNIPLFFRDATTFSSLPSNQSYRPLVTTMFAIDYSLGRGLHPFWFHVSIFALFTTLLFLLAFVIYRLLEMNAPSPANDWVALCAAGLYGLHPANADTVNYIVALADVMSALGVVASFALYFALPRLRRYFVYVLPAALAVLAKPPAAIFAVLFAAYVSLLASERTLEGAGKQRRVFVWLAESIPPLLICAAAIWFVHYMTPRTWIAGAADARNYLITQPYVILQYFKTFFCPTGLSADYDLNPFVTTDDARFWVGLIFLLVFVAATGACILRKRTRLIGFGLLWFLFTLLPTSLFPLAEVMNDHRTFLPYIGLVMAVAGAASLLVAYMASRLAVVKITATSFALVVLAGSSFATFQRNKVWKDDETLWRDVTMKSPKNGRGLMNYGNTLMAKGDFAGALDYYHRARLLAPQYPSLLINLAIAEEGTHQTKIAEQHFHEALRLAPSAPDSYTYYARFLIEHGRKDEAQPLLERGIAISPSDAFAHDLLSEINPPSPESLLSLSLQRYRENRYADCIAASRAALTLRPGYAEAWNNIGAAYNQLGRFAEAAAACEKALRFKPDFELARNNRQYALEHLPPSAK